MREDNLLCVAKRKFVVTTDSADGLKVYPNLAASMELSGRIATFRDPAGNVRGLYQEGPR